MPSHVRPTLSAAQIIILILTVLARVSVAISVGISQIVLRTIPSWPAKRIIAISLLRGIRELSFEQKRFLFEPTGQAVTKYCRAQHIDVTAVSLDCGTSAPEARLHLVRVPKGRGDNIILFFHGGGYVSALSGPGHMPLVLRSAEAANAATVAVLEYTLAPELRYPGQLIEAGTALSKLLENHKPENIILEGDSAGGHLVLSLLAHLLNPHPKAPKIDLKGAKLRAAVLVSPWVRLTYNAPSYTVNAKRDFLTKAAMEDFTRQWVPDRSEKWADPFSAAKALRQRMPVEAMLLTVGSWEVFLDDVLDISKLLKAVEVGSGDPVELVLSPEEVHDQPVMDCATSLEGHMLREILKWLKARAA